MRNTHHTWFGIMFKKSYTVFTEKPNCNFGSNNEKSDAKCYEKSRKAVSGLIGVLRLLSSWLFAQFVSILRVN